ncbi:transposase [Propionibacterium australiense]|nr:transposase [Propionibacterium australiense]
MKAEAILYASEGITLEIITKMVERSEKTIREWLGDWQDTRMCSVLTGHARNQTQRNSPAPEGRPQGCSGFAALTVRYRRRVLGRAGPTRRGEDPVRRRLRVRLFLPVLPAVLRESFKLPDPFDKRRDEQAIIRRMTEVKTQVNHLLEACWEVYAADEVRLEHEAETRRRLPMSQRTKLYVDRRKVPRSFFGAFSLTDKKMRMYPIEGNQNTEQIILTLEQLQRETPHQPDRCRAGRYPIPLSQGSDRLYQPASFLELITPIFLPPYAPDNNSVEHVWNTAKNNIANIQHETLAKLLEHSPRTPLAAPSTTTSNTSPNPDQQPIVFHDCHRIWHTRRTDAEGWLVLTVSIQRRTRVWHGRSNEIESLLSGKGT